MAYLLTIENAEDVFFRLGLMDPEFPVQSMIKRGILGFAIGGGFMTWLKPGFAFNQDGTPKPWSLMSDAEDAVLIPFWGYGVILAFIFGVLI